MKNLFTLLLLVAFMSAGAQKLTLIGNYSENVVSMCAQGCEFYEIGVFRLTEKLDLPEDAQSISGMGMSQAVPVVAKGELVDTDVLYTVAGPKADKSKMGETFQAKRVKVSGVKSVDLLSCSISEAEYKKYKDGNDFVLKMQIYNPSEQNLKLRVQVATGDYKQLKVKSGEQGKLEYTVPNNGYSSGVKVQISEQEVDPHNIYASGFKNAESTGLMYFVEQYVYIDKIDKD